MITLVVAMNKQRVIGVNNKLPWHIPEDLKHFKQVTMGLPIIMGRKTFESIGRVLPGRKNIVISRNSAWQHDLVKVYASLDAAINDNLEDKELCVIGGGEIFKQALPLAGKLHITIVDMEVANPSVFFPEIDLKNWRLVNSNKIITSDNISCEFNEYKRR